jgi:type 1 glutamine amidotransferase/nicotinamidase-related amidase
MTSSRLALLTLVLGLSSVSAAIAAENFSFRLRSRVEVEPGRGKYTVVEKAETWSPRETAVIVCDMWDLHHCLNAVRRGTELTPTMERVLKEARASGATIIHSPSSCMDAYKGHPARKRAQLVAMSANLPKEIGTWCYKIPSEEKGVYPIDQTDGGEDDDLKEHAEWAAKLAAMGRNPKAPWKSQTDKLTIDADKDYITDSGEEIWSLLEEKKIKNVILMGVHLNMCVLGRPFGLRQMAKNGKHVVLMRDMTDTMYNPERSPKVSHFAGTELMVEHVEKFVCSTITSDQLLGGVPFRFEKDKRPQVVFVIGDDEYKTQITLPQFASDELVKREFHVEYALASETDKNDFPGMNLLRDADVAVISARRRFPTATELAELKRFVAYQRGIVGIRTASHAFASRAGFNVPKGHAEWNAFDPEILGGNYQGHHKEGAKTVVSVANGAASHPILHGVDAAKLAGNGSLYKVSPLKSSTHPLLLGKIPGQPEEPIAWTNQPAHKGRVFYTSLGHPEDFKNQEFVTLLRNAIDWASKRD